ncbi:hypothetical protein J7M22_04135 [Candidatus Poribacteria bacterium]|nr:hypothetical protein [Candidatus Poribacteria bacterium]
MKTALALTLLLALALPSFAELTRQDVEQIIQQALEPIKQGITAIKLDIAEMKGKIEALEGKMVTKDDIITLQRELTKKMEESNARVNSRIDSMYYQMWAIWTVIFVTILAAIFGGPIFAQWWQKRQEQRETIRQIREKAQDLMKDHPELAEVFRNIGLI